MKTVTPLTHPVVSRILRDAANSRIVTDAEITKFCGHVAETAVRSAESVGHSFSRDSRESILESAFIHAIQASLDLPRYEEGRFVLTAEFERMIREAAESRVRAMAAELDARAIVSLFSCDLKYMEGAD